MKCNLVFSFYLQWESVGELDKLQSLKELILNHEEVIGPGNYFMEYTFARIRSLKVLLPLYIVTDRAGSIMGRDKWI